MSSVIAAAAAVIESVLRDAIETLTPSAASPRATANPRPRLAPATIATLPFSPDSMMPFPPALTHLTMTASPGGGC